MKKSVLKQNLTRNKTSTQNDGVLWWESFAQVCMKRKEIYHRVTNIKLLSATEAIRESLQTKKCAPQLLPPPSQATLLA